MVFLAEEEVDWRQGKVRRLLSFLFLVLFFGSVLAVEGVSPGSYEVDFEGGMERDFVFDFILSGEEELRVVGDLAGFVELDKGRISGDERVVATLKLPEEIDSFGINSIRIFAGDVVGIIKIKVPYPDRFVELELSAPNENTGEDVDIVLKVFNFGREHVFVNASASVYRQRDGERGEFVEGFGLGTGWVNVSGNVIFESVLNGSNYSSGDYVVVASVDYGSGVAEEENIFRLGEFKIRMLNYSGEFYGGRINRFEIGIENLWNDRVSEIYAEIRVVDSGEGFDSAIVSLNEWEKKTLVGYFNAKGIKRDVDVEISLHYGDKVEREIVRLKYLEGFNWVLFIGGFVVCGFVGLFLWWFWKKSRSGSK